MQVTDTQWLETSSSGRLEFRLVPQVRDARTTDDVDVGARCYLYDPSLTSLEAEPCRQWPAIGPPGIGGHPTSHLARQSPHPRSTSQEEGGADLPQRGKGATPSGGYVFC